MYCKLSIYLYRERQRQTDTQMGRKIYLKELAHVILGLANSKPASAGLEAGEPGKSSCHRQNSFLLVSSQERIQGQTGYKG